MKIPILFLFLVSASLGFTQEDSTQVLEEEFAHFPGGATIMKLFIQENVEYPEKAVKNWDQGLVYVSFIVEKNGTITAVKILDKGLTRELNAEAMRVVSIMPKWVPGTINGEPVRARCRLPITYTLGGRPPRKIRKRLKQNK